MPTATLSLLDLLRGDRTKRPRTDWALAGGLRAWLEDELSGRCPEGADPVLLTPRSVTTEGLWSVPAPIKMATASLVRVLVAQRCLSGEVLHPMDDAMAVLETEDPELAEQIHGLEPDAFAQLAAEVTAHDAALARHLGPIPGTWLPRANERLSVTLGGGAVILSATASLVLGPPALEVASVCLLEVTTSVPDDTVERRLGVLALLETLRAGAAPLRVGSLSTATATSCVLDVDDRLLAGAVSEISAALAARFVS
jgi:hypothetical protein